MSRSRNIPRHFGGRPGAQLRTRPENAEALSKVQAFVQQYKMQRVAVAAQILPRIVPETYASQDVPQLCTQALELAEALMSANLERGVPGFTMRPPGTPPEEGKPVAVGQGEAPAESQPEVDTSAS